MLENKPLGSSKFRNMDISFFEIFDALRNSHRTLILLVFLGLLAQTIRYYAADKVYEAKSLIQLSSLYLSQPQNNSANTSGESFASGNSIDSAMLIALMRNPTTYTDELLQSCSGKDLDTPVKVASSVSLTKYMGASSLLEMKIQAVSPEVALNCTKGVLKKIELFESSIRKPFYNNLNKRLQILGGRILETKKLINSNFNRGENSTISLVILLNDLSKLERDKDLLLSNLEGESEQFSHIIGEAYAASTPIGKSLRVYVFEGLVFGLLLGLIIIYINLGIRKMKISNR